MYVDLGKRSYPIVIGNNLLSNPEKILKYVTDNNVAIITNNTVAKFYLAPLQVLLKTENKRITLIILPDGEKEKNVTSLMKIFDTLLINKCDRETTLIALGGGVIGDLTGFAASTYMRGVPFIQIPTTLLAQVDAAIGGKTGINHTLGKNMIGTFYQPKAVITDLSTLKTLPNREFLAGLAEIIKYGIITDAIFFNWIEDNINALITRKNSELIYAIHRACELKTNIVSKDERETNTRAILNFGHTFGHAIESGLGYGKWLHGEAVGCGMVMATDLSYRLHYINLATKKRIVDLIKKAGLPITAPKLNLEHWLQLMTIDKKNTNGQIKFVILKELGISVVSSVEKEILLTTLSEHTAH